MTQEMTVVAGVDDAAMVVCFPRGRIRYLTPDGPRSTPLQGEMIVGMRVSPREFRAHFGPLGTVR